MVEWKEPHNVAACARCGSGRVHPKLLVMGPIAGIDSDSRSYVCEACGYEGLPVIFDTDQERGRFERETKGPIPSSGPEPSVTSLPILPLATQPLLNVPIFDSIPFHIASIVGVRWNGQAIEKTAYRVSFPEYWAAVGGSRYNASLVYLLDLTGIERGEPNFDVLRAIGRRCDIWIDPGARDTDDVMDAYMVDVERVILGTKSLSSLTWFEDAYALSAETMPCLDWDGRIVWRDSRESRTDLEDVARTLAHVGYEAVCVMDLPRLGTELGPDPAFLSRLEALDLDVYLGGGIQETDVEDLRKRGFAGGLVDPYTPVIRDLLRPPRAEGPAEASAPERVAKPAPSPRALPDV
jgi:uncharacterized protein related to proFAR isomerase